MIVNFNIAALSAYRGMSRASAAIARSMQRLSSGLRINSAADDPAGLAISERMRAQIRGLLMASRNAQDGISMIQTAEGALNETHAMIQRIRELVIQAGNGTTSESDRRAIQDEIDQLLEEIGGTAERTAFNGIDLLDGSQSESAGEDSGLWLQLGANGGEGLRVFFGDMRASNLGASAGHGFALSGVDVLSRSTDDNLAVVDQALEDVSRERGRMGAYVNRLEHTINNLETTAENLIAAESRIRDVDMAKEMMELVRNQILYEVAMTVFAQAQQQAKRMLRLLLPETEW
jgi:flagellin